MQPMKLFPQVQPLKSNEAKAANTSTFLGQAMAVTTFF